MERSGQRKEALDYQRQVLDNEVARPAKGAGDRAGFPEASRLLGALRLQPLDVVPAQDALAKALAMDTALLAESLRKPEYRIEMALTPRSLGTLDRRATPRPPPAKSRHAHAP